MSATHGISRINLLPKGSFQFSVLGKVLKWTTTVGRVLVVMTEFVVIMAFVSRFYFDKKLSDLNEETEGKLAIIEGYASVEEQAREIIERQSVLMDSRSGLTDTKGRTMDIAKHLPEGVTLETLRLEGKEVELTGQARSEGTFAQTLASFKQANNITKVSLGQITFDQTQGNVSFNIKMIYK